jgi:tungstate transport system substrate-binding protein
MACALAASCASPPQSTLTLATTTSVGNSGLLDVLAAEFRRDHGIVIRAHLVGSGRALAMLADEHAEAVISHAPDAEADALRKHPDWSYSKIMFNDFVIAGPESDPADVKDARDAEDAFARIARSHARFISRGDSSGTHEREKQLWSLAGAAPRSENLIIAGQGMGTTLRIADETNAYTLTDRGTFLQNAAAVRLRILFEGGARLINTYAVITGAHPDTARRFADWLTRGRGRDVIRGYRVRGTPLFTPWPQDQPRSDPAALPR